jgi:AcrR family transcriptional regulator
VKTKRVSKVSKLSAEARATLQPRIVEAAGALFLSRGFVRVTSADIAARLGISKATLYKAFPGKEEILRQVIRRTMNEILGGVERLIDDGSLGFIEKMVALLSFLTSKLSRFEPVLIRDLQRGLPDVWSEIEEFRRDKIYKNFKIILEAGRRGGHFRADIDIDLLLAMFAGLIQEFVNPAAMLRSGLSPSETFESVIKVFFQGILTATGRLDFSSCTPALFEPRKEGAS